jgi:hypothetical protein
LRGDSFFEVWVEGCLLIAVASAGFVLSGFDSAWELREKRVLFAPFVVHILGIR